MTEAPKKKKRTIRTPAQRLADMKKDMAKLEEQVAAEEEARKQRVRDKAGRLEAEYVRLDAARQVALRRAAKAKDAWENFLRENKEDLA